MSNEYGIPQGHHEANVSHMESNEHPEYVYRFNIEEENDWRINEPVNRKIIETMMSDKPNGYFYIRPRNGADSKIYPYALSLKFDGGVIHIKIERTDDGRLVLAPWKKGEETFDTVDNLVSHYQDHVFTFCYGEGKAGTMSLNRGRRY